MPTPCPKCQGRLAPVRDEFGLYISCVNCGWHDNVEYARKTTDHVTDQDADGRFDRIYPNALVLQIGKVQVKYIVDWLTPQNAQVVKVSHWPAGWHSARKIKEVKAVIRLMTGKTVKNFEDAVQVAASRAPS